MSRYPFSKYLKVSSCSGSQIKACTPGYESKKPSFSANEETGLWIDHRTQEKGNWFKFCRDICPDAKTEVVEHQYNYRSYKSKNIATKLRIESYEEGENKLDKKIIWKNKDEKLYKLYNHENLNLSEQIWLVEGEKTVDYLKSIGFFNAVTAGNCSDWKLKHSQEFKNCEIVIFPDSDKSGRRMAVETYSQLKSDNNVSIAIIRDLKKSEDIRDLIESHELSSENLNSFISDRCDLHCQIPKDWITEIYELPKISNMNDIDYKPAEYLDGDDKILPVGMITGISGDPGTGKSRLIRKIISDLSLGKSLNGKKVKPVASLIFNGEDHTESTVKKDFDNYGADQSRIHIIDEVCTLGGDLLAKYKDFILETEIKAVFVDTIASYMPEGGDLNSLNSVKDFLKEIINFAKCNGICFVFLRHLNKQVSLGTSIYRGMGSIGVTGSFRSEHHVVKNQNDSLKRNLINVKSNIHKTELNCGFTFNENGMVEVEYVKKEEDIDAAYVEITSTSLGGERDRKTKVEEAKEFLVHLLKNIESMSSKNIKRHTHENGITDATLKRAKEAVCDAIQVTNESGKIVEWRWKLNEEIKSNLSVESLSPVLEVEQVEISPEEKNYLKEIFLEKTYLPNKTVSSFLRGFGLSSLEVKTVIKYACDISIETEEDSSKPIQLVSLKPDLRSELFPEAQRDPYSLEHLEELQ